MRPSPRGRIDTSVNPVATTIAPALRTNARGMPEMKATGPASNAPKIATPSVAAA